MSKHKVVLSLALLGAIVFATIPSYSKNLGHRTGADVYQDMPENSLQLLQRVLYGQPGKAALQTNPDFVYLETDTRETYDHEIVMLHDETLARVVDFAAVPASTLKHVLADPTVKACHKVKKLTASDLRVECLTLAQLQLLPLKMGKGEVIPTLNEYLATAAEFGLKKPIVVEIKKLSSDLARTKFIDLMSSFRDQYMSTVKVIVSKKYDFKDLTAVDSFPKHFQLSFGKKWSASRKTWCTEFRNSGFSGVFVPLSHSTNNCQAEDQ